MRPMQGFAQAGITVLFDAETPSVKVGAQGRSGELPVMAAQSTRAVIRGLRYLRV